MIPQKTHTYFFKGYRKKYIFKIIKRKSITLLSWTLESQIRRYFFNIFPSQNLSNAIHCGLWYLSEMEAWLFYIRLTYSIFSSGISSKSAKHSPDFNYTEVCLSPSYTLFTWITRYVKASYQTLTNHVLLKKSMTVHTVRAPNSLGFNPILQKFGEMICEIIVRITVWEIFLIFCHLCFIKSFVVKNNFSELWN